ncbi:clasp N terminal-domain-containing protein, partial [Hygrophoropsis aurantiaca]
MSSERLEKLINQCKSNDVDLKVDAVTKLQVEFESGTEITDPEPLISVLKACLRISNQHLTTATLSALPPFLPLVISRINAPAPQARPLSASSSNSSAPGSAHDTATLRQVMLAFLPAPGVFERLGDSREKARDKARETLVILGGLAFRSTPSVSTSSKIKDSRIETPLAMFERFLKDSGLSSKVWRVREQSILTLVHIRRTHHLFPIRPYLPLLVDTLEDTDGNVRACAGPSVIELFTGPGVSDAARSDLKKELTKKGVRKAIVDNIQTKLMSGSTRSAGASTPHSEGSENGDGIIAAKKEYVPPSLMLQQGRRPTVGAASGNGAGNGMSRAVSQGNVREIPRPASRSAMVSPPPLPTPTSDTASAVESAFIASSRDLENEFAAFVKPFEGRETEHNWAVRERAIQRVRGMIKGDIHNRYPDVFFLALKEGFIQASLKTLASLRTTVSANTCSLYTELAIALGPNMDPFCDTLYAHLLRMAGFTKKIAATQSQASVSALMQNTSPQPRTLLPLLWAGIQEKTVQARAFIVSHIKEYLSIHGTKPSARAHIESAGGVDILEKCVRKALADPNAGVRESARIAFWVFDGVWHDRAVVIIEGLDTIARKQLEKACPNPGSIVGIAPPTTPSVKKSSVAAAIAASRAKAKAIATAPPTLRHQATSSSHVTRATSPPAKRVITSPVSPSAKGGSAAAASGSNGRSASPTPLPRPSRMSLSPPTSPRSRILSGGTMPRSVSSSAIPMMASHTRSTSDSSQSNGSTDASTRKRTSSPLANIQQLPNRGPAVRKAISPSSAGMTTDAMGSPTPRRTAAVPVPPRQSTTFSDVPDTDESLLLASAVPIPEDSDSDMDESVNLMSFSTPYKLFPPASDPTPVPAREYQSTTISSPSRQYQLPTPSFSPRSEQSTPNTVSNALSNDSPGKSPGLFPVEEALRTRAEQAQSAAERLLELNDPEEEDHQHSVIPASLLLGSGGVGHGIESSGGNGTFTSTPNPKAKLTSSGAVTGGMGIGAAIRRTLAPPVTPDNRTANILRQAALFKNSPAAHGNNGNGHVGGESLVKPLQDQTHETGWWLKRTSMIDHGTPLKGVSADDRVEELRHYCVALESDEADIRVLQKLSLLCSNNPVAGETDIGDGIGFNDTASPLSPGLGLPASVSP